MRIKVVNPNTSASTTRRVGAVAAAATGMDILAVGPSMGPGSFEGHDDEAVSALGVLGEIRSGERAGYDAYVIAGFGDLAYPLPRTYVGATAAFAPVRRGAPV